MSPDYVKTYTLEDFLQFRLYGFYVVHVTTILSDVHDTQNLL